MPGKNKHLTLDDRASIEKGLNHGLAIRAIADSIGKDPTTVSKEIRLRRQLSPRNTPDWNRCGRRRECVAERLCGGACGRAARCRACRLRKRNRVCPDFVPDACPALARAPHVCNGCRRKSACRLDKYWHRAEPAHKAYKTLLAESREGINRTEEELAAMDAAVSEGTRKGQSPAHICHTSGAITCSERTVYTYISDGCFSIGNLDLPRKVKYKKRKGKGAERRRELKALEGRRYSDFIAFMAGNDLPATEMDTVKGREGSKKALLTMLPAHAGVLLAFLLDACSQDCVVAALDSLERALTPEVFRKTFPVLLADRGSEFLDPEMIETSVEGGRRARVFYCDANAPFQKPHLEKSHTHIRSVFPKKETCGTSRRNTFDDMTQEKISIMARHADSLARDSLGGMQPIKLAEAVIGKETVEAPGLELIPPEDVVLTPALLR